MQFNYQKAMPTPWGKADYKHLICTGVYEVGTPSHGGIMVGKAQAKKLLSPEAIRQGMPWNQYICFEEDCDWALFVYEQPELWAEYYKTRNPITYNNNADRMTPEAWKLNAKKTLDRWHTDYLFNVHNI